MEMVFEGVIEGVLIQFQDDAKSEAEAIAVDKIVNMFRFYMHQVLKVCKHQEHS